MDKGKIERIVEQYAELVAEEFPVDMVVLFGSYANGTARTDSDIDVAVIVDEIEGDILESSARLFHLTWDIDVRMEPILLEKKDERSGFLEEIKKTGQIIYKRDQALA